MTTNLREIPERYQEQVDRFLTYYRNGQQIVERYLALVTNPDYQTKKTQGRSRAHTDKLAQIDYKKDRKELIILREITLNPGQDSAQIARKTGMSPYCINKRLSSLIEKGKITGFSEEKAGYYPVSPNPGEVYASNR